MLYLKLYATAVPIRNEILFTKKRTETVTLKRARESVIIKL